MIDRWIRDGFDYYQELGVSPDADRDAILLAARFRARKLHPDREPDPVLKKLATEATARVTIARDVLADPELRGRYDAWRDKNLAAAGDEADTHEARPEVIVSPELVQFGTVSFGEIKELVVAVRNVGGNFIESGWEPRRGEHWQSWSEGPSEDDPADLISKIVVSVSPAAATASNLSTPVEVFLDDSVASFTINATFVGASTSSPRTPPRAPTASTSHGAAPARGASARTSGHHRTLLAGGIGALIIASAAGGAWSVAGQAGAVIAAVFSLAAAKGWYDIYTKCEPDTGVNHLIFLGLTVVAIMIVALLMGSAVRDANESDEVNGVLSVALVAAGVISLWILWPWFSLVYFMRTFSGDADGSPYLFYPWTVFEAAGATFWICAIAFVF